MVNSEEFTQRLQQLMDHYHLNASAFAESIGVQRSAISHILSGRNKPSLEFVMKILDTYPDVELYWLLNGKGDSPFREKSAPIQEASPDLFNTQEVNNAQNEPSPLPNTPLNPTASVVASTNRRAVKVVIFYSDNTFEELSTD